MIDTQQTPGLFARAGRLRRSFAQEQSLRQAFAMHLFRTPPRRPQTARNPKMAANSPHQRDHDYCRNDRGNVTLNKPSRAKYVEHRLVMPLKKKAGIDSLNK
ncbi:hypothetical protein [Pelagibius sp. Alg239-R121]|uniref:hypothetical protein n=1 Tax=Pelagibius sp. Alg239-R121 TaxID=2993448 RepID=UPI0024A651E5|nr:hypothetical protein [Pelagibius sp. Alg239-R121]